QPQIQLKQKELDKLMASRQQSQQKLQEAEQRLGESKLTGTHLSETLGPLASEKLAALEMRLADATRQKTEADKARADLPALESARAKTEMAVKQAQQRLEALAADCKAARDAAVELKGTYA